MTDYVNSLNAAEFFLLLTVIFAAVIQLFLLLAFVFRPVRLVWASLLPGFAAIVGGLMLFMATR